MGLINKIHRIDVQQQETVEKYDIQNIKKEHEEDRYITA